MVEFRRGENGMEHLPIVARIIIRVLFREGVVVFAFLVMLGVILGIIPSPYLGKPLELLVESHKDQLTVLQDIRDDLKQWRIDDERRKR